MPLEAKNAQTNEHEQQRVECCEDLDESCEHGWIAHDTPHRALLLKLAEQKMGPQCGRSVAAPERDHDNPWWLPQEYTSEELGMDDFGSEYEDDEFA